MSKIVLIGDNAVGKTSLIMKYLGREIPNKPTIGIELHNIEVQGKRIIAWDLSGQKKFFPVLNPYLKGADLYVLVFDLSRPKTLESIIKWSEIVYSVAGNKAKAVLVGNKKDLSRKIDHETIERILSKIKINVVKYIETSALTGENVKELFIDIEKYLKQ